MPALEISVPVAVDPSITDLASGIFGVSGELVLTGDQLVFAYETRDMQGEVSGQAAREIPVEGVQNVVFKRHPFGAALVLYPRTLNLLEGMPGGNTPTLTFKVKGSDRADAAALAEALQHRLEDVMDSIPFKLPDSDWGLTEIRGLLYLEDEFLVFEVGQGIEGGSRDDYQIVKIELKALVEMDYKRGFLTDEISVRPKKRDLLEALPGRHAQVVTLSVRRKHRDAAETLVREAQRLMRVYKEMPRSL